MDRQTTEADATLSSGESGTSLEQQIKAAELKGKSDALADVNRTLAESTKARKAAEAAEQRVTQMVREYEETIKDEPDKLNEFRGRQAKAQANAELARVTQELDEAKTRLAKIETEKGESATQQKAREIATRLSVDVDTLIKLAKFTDGSPEAIEDIPKDLSKINPQNPLNPDSNGGKGSNASEKQIRERFITRRDDPQAKADYLAWRRQKGI